MDSQQFKILHLSDIHFGQTHDHVINLIPKDNIDLLILTGDLTQRATSVQFKHASRFLQEFKCPVFLIPGNHDVPLYNVFLRIFKPYRRFCEYMSQYSADFYENQVLAIFGLWTLNRFTVQSERLASQQLEKLQLKMNSVGPEKFKIIAAHHPLNTIDQKSGQPDLTLILDAKPDLLMWGHNHQSSVTLYDQKNKSGPLMIAAGTGFSSRTREERNSYNLISLTGDTVKVEIYTYSETNSAFEVVERSSFNRIAPGHFIKQV